MRIPWEQEEAVVLIDAYLNNGSSLKIPASEIQHISDLLRERGRILGIPVDDKFRNSTGINMQIACIHYIATNGQSGMANASKLFYDTYELARKDPEAFQKILLSFHQRFGE